MKKEKKLKKSIKKELASNISNKGGEKEKRASLQFDTNMELEGKN